MSNSPEKPNPPADADAHADQKDEAAKNSKDAAQEATKQEEKEEFLPAPLPEEQRETAEHWLRPPGQSSG